VPGSQSPSQIIEVPEVPDEPAVPLLPTGVIAIPTVDIPELGVIEGPVKLVTP
jgi:hypothetical protein